MNPVMSGDASSAIQQIDELVDDLMDALGITDSDDSSTPNGGGVALPDEVVATIQRIDALLDELQEHMGIEDVDKPNVDVPSLAGALSAAKLDELLTFAKR